MTEMPGWVSPKYALGRYVVEMIKATIKYEKYIL